jgi:hypothetical protein
MILVLITKIYNAIYFIFKMQVKYTFKPEAFNESQRVLDGVFKQALRLRLNTV